MYKVRINRKGQVTIPAPIRKKMNMDEGMLLEVNERQDGLLLMPIGEIMFGEIVGHKEYKKIVTELDNLRSSKWR